MVFAFISGAVLTSTEGAALEPQLPNGNHIVHNAAVKLVYEADAAVAAAHVAYMGRGFRISSLMVRETPPSWGVLFADNAVPSRFAETVYARGRCMTGRISCGNVKTDGFQRG